MYNSLFIFLILCNIIIMFISINKCREKLSRGLTYTLAIIFYNEVPKNIKQLVNTKNEKTLRNGK